jgi:hypothetical protein
MYFVLKILWILFVGGSPKMKKIVLIFSDNSVAIKKLNNLNNNFFLSQRMTKNIVEIFI